ncbi:alpha/beta hydrolase [Bradyrhizobium sp. HKCCYLR20261]|uniref:alpha/beta hydrolase n=1 Tax=Bradyrhizobium sp. HKCCYLR20261 TaxID=3420760 RepID=UPI003EBF4F8B
MRSAVVRCALALLLLTSAASAEESAIRVGPLDAVLTTPSGIERPPVALLIAGSGSTDRDGNGPQLKPATLKKLAEQFAARGIASLRYDKRGARGWKAEFGRPEDFRFKDYVDDSASLVDYLRGKFARIVLVGHSEGGLVAILTARRTPVDRLVLLTTSARRQGDLLKAQLEKKLPATKMEPVAKAIDAIMAGQIVDPPPPELPIAPSMQPGIGSAFAEDPIDPLKQIVIPILIVGGARDSQIPRLDAVALATAAPAAKTLWLPDMNHVLVDVANEDENLSSYNDPDRPLDPDMVEAVAGFITAPGPR